MGYNRVKALLEEHGWAEAWGTRAAPGGDNEVRGHLATGKAMALGPMATSPLAWEKT